MLTNDTINTEMDRDMLVTIEKKEVIPLERKVVLG